MLWGYFILDIIRFMFQKLSNKGFMRMSCLLEDWLMKFIVKRKLWSISNYMLLLENDRFGIFIEFYIGDCVEIVWFRKY